MTLPAWAAHGDRSPEKDPESLRALGQKGDTNRNWLVRRTYDRNTKDLNTDGAKAQRVAGTLEGEGKDQRRSGQREGYTGGRLS